MFPPSLPGFSAYTSNDSLCHEEAALLKNKTLIFGTFFLLIQYLPPCYFHSLL